jgi:hypothetical protein
MQSSDAGPGIESPLGTQRTNAPHMSDMTTPQALPQITPLQERAIKRFEYDILFHSRVQAEATRRREIDPSLAIHTSLQDVMVEFQSQDEVEYPDEAIVRGATSMGQLIGVDYPAASVKRQEALKIGVRHLLDEVFADQ